MRYFYFLLSICLFGCGNDIDNSEELKLAENTNLETTLKEEKENINKPQTLEERIQEIKGLYKKAQSYNGRKDCKTGTKVTHDGLNPEMEYEFLNHAEICSYGDGFIVKTIELNGYEWMQNTTFFFKDDQLFFAHLYGASEGYAYEDRVYYSRSGEAIKVLAANNDESGGEVGKSNNVTNEKEGMEILQNIANNLSELNAIFNKEI